MTNPSPDPFVLFQAWLQQAYDSEPNDPNAMALATATPDGKPSSRMVLLKEIDPVDRPGAGLVFYTNLESRKGRELAANPFVALLFHWKTMRRQVRVEGVAEGVAEAEADTYYASRPRLSRLGAWASDQSRPLAEPGELERRLSEAEARFPEDPIPRPSYWAGYRVIPQSFEFWEDRPYRLHDRLVLTRDASGWRADKLFP